MSSAGKGQSAGKQQRGKCDQPHLPVSPNAQWEILASQYIQYEAHTLVQLEIFQVTVNSHRVY
jgi:hypothetical protein